MLAIKNNEGAIEFALDKSYADFELSGDDGSTMRLTMDITKDMELYEMKCVAIAAVRRVGDLDLAKKLETDWKMTEKPDIDILNAPIVAPVPFAGLTFGSFAREHGVNLDAMSHIPELRESFIRDFGSKLDFDLSDLDS